MRGAFGGRVWVGGVLSWFQLLRWTLYLFNILVIALTGKHPVKDDCRKIRQDLIIEMPPYRVPTFKNVFEQIMVSHA